MVLGILAHVDAGKTTLSEALLYESGRLRSLGRVDHKDTFLDTDSQERERGITIFSKQARLSYGGREITLLDTPGHVDFSAEMERVLSCLDYAILVISSAGGVQGHTRTLWRLLKHYEIPALLFVNKMDQDGADREAILQELKNELSENCVDVTDLYHEDPAARQTDPEEIYENIAVCEDSMLEYYMEEGELTGEMLREAVCSRHFFPCFFGSALKDYGVRGLLEGLITLTREPVYPKAFAARVFKIGRDARGARLTHMKITGGSLSIREKLEYQTAGSGRGDEDTEEVEGEATSESSDGRITEKVDQIRRYSGEKFDTVDKAIAGEIVSVTGLSSTFPGQGLGAEEDIVMPVLEPVLTYQLLLPREISPLVFMEKMRILEEEDPKLKVVWRPELKEIHVQLMGEIQMQVLQQTIRERFGVAVSFGPGSIVYKETIACPVEGVGHFEPLRHYAEAHILLSPGEPGSGITVDTVCSEDVLDRNWQRLIATHIEERTHRGVLIGAALTDVHMTIVTGRAHPKHTEGGDFRQATYRAIRQGLKSTQSILLEPYYSFRLEIPVGHVGRALTDLDQRFGKMEAPEFFTRGSREMALIRGRAPVSTMQDYISQVHAYTQGLGALLLEVAGYDICHNPEEVIAAARYDSELDFRNPTGSVFCAHGSGFVVPWQEVPAYMHMDYVFPPELLDDLWRYRAEAEEAQTEGGKLGWLKAGLSGGENRNRSARGFAAEEAESISGTSRRTSWEKSVSRMSEVELDAELADVYAREFGMSREDMEEQERRKWRKKNQNGIPEGLSGKPRTVKYDQHGNPIYPKKEKKADFLIVDGYNMIFSWEELKELSRSSIDAARDKLIEALCNYQGYKRCRLAVVFDAWKVRDNGGKQMFYDGVSRKMTSLKEAREKAAAAQGNAAGKTLPQGIEVIFTRTDELADARIERMVHDNSSKYRITVATNDGLEQLTILSQGALRMPASELKQEMEREEQKSLEEYRSKQ